ncbi:hypothetical protein AX17_001164 [Amanita inopinata Kibby_2008]|nr:hypothetical protein AX17_001164 [Amanita inopinata Kibby_2008]
MAEKDVTVRLRNAVKENNLFIVKRLIKKTDMRNPDIVPRRFTSLAWAAVLGHEDTFEFLLTAGHDDDESSKDSENNTILMLLAETKPPPPDLYAVQSMHQQDMSSAILRMARLYIERFPRILDWSNMQGRTALHLAALKGNEELAKMFCDLGADVNLSDNCGNTPLHYASSWGHVAIVQLLIERGCLYAVKNNSGFTASDYAYSYSTQDTLQNTARLQYEIQKKQRRNLATRGLEWNGSTANLGPPPVPPKDRDGLPRTRSGSGTSRTTVTSDGDFENTILTPSNATSLPVSSQSQQSVATNTHYATPSTSTSKPVTPPAKPISALSPIANRVREMDADAMEKYMRRTRSDSQGTNIQNGSQQGPSGTVQDDVAALPRQPRDPVTPRRLRPSASAAQLRTTSESPITISGLHLHSESRSRAGTNPTATRPSLSPIPVLARSTSTAEQGDQRDGNYTGPSRQYAQFPDPPGSEESTPTVNRRRALHLLSKSTITADTPSHRRGISTASVRGS